jgi:hypothetical protein
MHLQSCIPATQIHCVTGGLRDGSLQLYLRLPERESRNSMPGSVVVCLGRAEEEPAGGDLAGLELAALAFERTADRAAVRAYAIDSGGALRELAVRSGPCGVHCPHVEILSELLTRGLRVQRPFLVSADRCHRVVARLRAAFGQNVVLLPAPSGGQSH